MDQGERFALRLVASLLGVDEATVQGHWKKFTKWGNEHQDSGDWPFCRLKSWISW
jgi:hypothetical protein